MTKKLLLFRLLLLLLLPCSVGAQQLLRGRIFDQSDNRVLFPATVQNRSRSHYGTSDQGGNYKIQAAPGDTVLIAYLGYQPDTVIVNEQLLSTITDIHLRPASSQLAEIKVSAGLNAYQVDSIERRRLFGSYLSVKRLAGTGTPEGFGITFSPLTYFSKAARRQRRFRRSFNAYEAQQRAAYFNMLTQQSLAGKYSSRLITQLTGLSGDSLALFEKNYPPDTSFVAHASADEIRSYILVRYKQFLKQK